VRRTPVGTGDRGHVREAETGAAARPALDGAAEALERTRHEFGRQPRAAVAQVQLDPAVDRARRDADASRAVAKRVLDEVAEPCSSREPGAGRRSRSGRGLVERGREIVAGRA
jgi:hypothetical protein